MSDRKAVIKNADMGEEMQQDAVDCATQALEKYNIEKVIKPKPGNFLSDSINQLLGCSVCLFFDPTRKGAKNRYAIAFMHARQSEVKLFLPIRRDLKRWHKFL